MPDDRIPHFVSPFAIDLVADDNRRDAEWLRQQIMSLSNHAILVNGVTVAEMRAALHAIHAGRPWRGSER